MENGNKHSETDETPTTFRLGYVPGVTPAKWVSMWKKRREDTPIELIQLEALDNAASIRRHVTDMSLVRLPINRDGLHVIELYRETSVVVFPKDHHFAAADSLSVSDLAEEVVQHPLDCPLQWATFPGQPAVERLADTATAIEVVAAGVGVVVVPQSLARLHHRKDLTYIPLEDAPESPVALVWPAFEENPENIEDFIGIIRGRAAGSSRAARSNPDQQKLADADVKAQEKAERAERVTAKQKRRQAQQPKKEIRTPSGRKPGTGGVAGKAKGAKSSATKPTGRMAAKATKAKRKGR